MPIPRTSTESPLQRPDWHLVYRGFIAGAAEARANPRASERDIDRAADAYVKLVEIRLRESEFDGIDHAVT